jgi:hypothetical protein
VLSLAERRVEALFRHDTRGRLVEINQWEGGLARRLGLKPFGVDFHAT